MAPTAAAAALEDSVSTCAAHAKERHPSYNAKRKPKTGEEVQLGLHMTMVRFINNQGLPDNTSEKLEMQTSLERPKAIVKWEEHD
jgi:hypothetical protein